jgi:glycosyltransferase involved in cell wall biosynthesis
MRRTAQYGEYVRVRKPRVGCHRSQRVYVDSGSSDGSAQLALKDGVTVIELTVPPHFTAARARNAGLEREERRPRCEYDPDNLWEQRLSRVSGLPMAVSADRRIRGFVAYNNNGAGKVRGFGPVPRAFNGRMTAMPGLCGRYGV